LEYTALFRTVSPLVFRSKVMLNVWPSGEMTRRAVPKTIPACESVDTQVRSSIFRSVIES
jgi:hypothetical protein